MEPGFRRRGFFTVFSTMVTLLVIASCGGGGDGSSPAPPPPPSSPSWGMAELIETDNAGSAYSPKIAFDADGNAIAVWDQDDGILRNIWANYFDGAAWGTAELIETDNADSAYGPQIAFDAAGNAIAVWYQDYDIWANYFDGAAWGAAELIETDNAGDADSPKIAIDANGNAIAVWNQSDGTRYNIWANYFDGAAWGTAELIETDNTGNAYYPKIAIDAAGNAIAVWYQFDGTRYNIWANYFDGAAWGTAELIETDNAGDAGGPQIAFDAAGNAIAVWYQDDGTRENIWANYFDGTDWGTAELIETDNAGYASIPQIAFDAAGNAIAVWVQSDGSRRNIWANYFDGAAWGTAELIETDNAGDAGGPQIAVDATGNAIAVWAQDDGTRYNIWANCFDGATWGTAELIETDDAGDAWVPQIAVDGDGNAIAAWVQNDGTRNNIWANYFK